VVSVPTGRIRTLISEGESGFLFDNDADSWRAFLKQLPTRERLRDMGVAAAAAGVRHPSWDDTAASYLALCKRQLQIDGRLEG
jgi:glycosyltransferase involved in cell wall biosynthesis